MEIQTLPKKMKIEKTAVVLNTDIWFLVLEQLDEILDEDVRSMGWSRERLESSMDGLRSLRLVSKDFDQIITPLVYANINLANYSLMTRLTHVSAPPCAGVKDNIIAHAEQMALTEERDDQFRAATVDLISRCRKLESITWGTYWVWDGKYLATLYINAFLQHSQSCHFCIHQEFAIITEDGCRKGPGTLHPRFAALPSSLNVTARNNDLLTVDHSPSSLRHLSIDASMGLGHLEPFGTRFPPMEKVWLSYYEWVHRRNEYRQLWDFSKLRCLGLHSMFQDFIDEFEGVPPSDLAQLRSLKIHGWWDSEITDVGWVQKNLSTFLGGLKNLKNLKIEYESWESFLPLEDLAAASGDTLQKVRLRDPRSLRGEDFDRPISIRNLSVLQSSFPQLTHLGLDLARNNPQLEPFLNLLATFRQLRVLELWAEGSIKIEGIESGNSDCEAAKWIMGSLHFQKLGVPFDLVTIHFPHEHYSQ